MKKTKIIKIIVQILLIPCLVYFRVFIHEIGHLLIALERGYNVSKFVVNLDNSGYIVVNGYILPEDLKIILLGGIMLVLIVFIFLLMISHKKYLIINITCIILMINEILIFNRFNDINTDIGMFLNLYSLEEQNIIILIVTCFLYSYICFSCVYYYRLGNYYGLKYYRKKHVVFVNYKKEIII